jgi:hypothetical protein
MSHPGDTALKNTPITVPRSSTGSIMMQTFKSTSGLPVCTSQRPSRQRSSPPQAPFSWPRDLASTWFTTLPPPPNKCVWVRTTTRQYPLSHATANNIINTTLHPPPC